MNPNLKPNPSDKTWLWVAIGVVVAGGAALVLLRHRPESAPPPAITPAPLPPPAAAAPVPEHHPIEEAQAPAPQAPPLPSLDQSDDVIGTALVDLVGQSLFESLFERKDIVRRIVATVDNLPREAVPAKVWALKPAPGHFLVTGKDDTLATAPENAVRYAAYLQLVRTADARRLVAAYVQHYPLFQQAYEGLGYPKGYFNDRLILAIDNLLATPTATSPQLLTQPHVLYQYADPSLEALSFGQKVLLRMGADDENAIKGKLREIRTLLVKEAPPKHL